MLVITQNIENTRFQTKNIHKSKKKEISKRHILIHLRLYNVTIHRNWYQNRFINE